MGKVFNLSKLLLPYLQSGNTSIYSQLNNIEDEEIQSALSEIMVSEYEVNSSKKFVEDIINNYDRNRLLARKEELLLEINNKNLAKEEIAKLERELSSIIIELAKMK